MSSEKEINISGTISKGEEIIKNLFILGFFIGLIFGIYMLIKFFNSPAGQIIQKLFGGLATAMEGAAEALNYMTNSFNKCTQGKDNDGNSVSSGSQAVSCFSLIGILAGFFIGGPLLLAGAKALYNRLRPGSEQMKTMEAQLKENIKKVMDPDGKTYNDIVENVKAKLDKTGKYDETEEGRAKLQSDSEKLATSSIIKKAADIKAEQTKDISKQTENSADSRIASEAQQRAVEAGNVRSAVIDTIAKDLGVESDDLNDIADKAEEQADEPLRENIEE